MKKAKIIKNIAILTSGGDAPGMNSLIKGLTQNAIEANLNVFLVKNGYLGLYRGEIEKVNLNTVNTWDSLSGTAIFSARFPEFEDKEIQKKVLQNLSENQIDAIITIGGDGTFRGALRLSKNGIKTIAIPGTIDNDIAYNDYTVGFLSALETIVETIDKIRATITSHHRIALIETMGRNCGDLTLYAGIATSSEIISIPEQKLSEKQIIEKINNLQKKESNKAIIVLVTEQLYDLNKLSKQIEKETDTRTIYNVIGHIQRGAKPSAIERFNANRLAKYAIEKLLEGEDSIMVSIFENKLISKPIKETINTKKTINANLLSHLKNNHRNSEWN